MQNMFYFVCDYKVTPNFQMQTFLSYIQVNTVPTRLPGVMYQKLVCFKHCHINGFGEVWICNKM
jgi:hypothetical protein